MKQKILIIDDMAENRKLLVSLIKEHTDYEITISRGGIHVLKYLGDIIKNPPDLILLDILMPEIDGYEVARTLKATREIKHVPIIFITALNDVKSKTLAFMSGGVDYISKPFNKYELLSRIKVHLELQQARAALSSLNTLEPVEHFTSGIARDVEEPINEINRISTLIIESVTALKSLFSHYMDHFEEPDKQNIERLLTSVDSNIRDINIRGLKTETTTRNLLNM